MREVNAEMFRVVTTDPTARGSGASIVALLAPPESELSWLAWVGDCRAFTVTPDRLESLFEPHTLVAEQLRTGVITPEEARVSRFKNIIIKSLGYEELVVPGVVEVRLGARMLLCTDGLLAPWSELDDASLRLASELSSTPIERAADRIVDAACARGAMDNLTAIVVERG